MQLQHVSVPMPPGGQEAGRGFYVGLLGLEERAVPPHLDPSSLVWFRTGDDLELHLFASGDAPPPSQHLCLRLDGADGGLDALRRRLEEAGVETQDTTEIVGRPRFMCRDPFGNRLELTEWAASV